MANRYSKTTGFVPATSVSIRNPPIIPPLILPSTAASSTERHRSYRNSLLHYLEPRLRGHAGDMKLWGCNSLPMRVRRSTRSPLPGLYLADHLRIPLRHRRLTTLRFPSRSLFLYALRASLEYRSLMRRFSSLLTGAHSLFRIQDDGQLTQVIPNPPLALKTYWERPASSSTRPPRTDPFVETDWTPSVADEKHFQDPLPALRPVWCPRSRAVWSLAAGGSGAGSLQGTDRAFAYKRIKGCSRRNYVVPAVHGLVILLSYLSPERQLVWWSLEEYACKHPQATPCSLGYRSSVVDRAEVCETSPSWLGNDGIFLMGGNTRDAESMPILLRSGDVVIMSGPCKRAYHGLPRILETPLHRRPRCCDTRDSTEGSRTTTSESYSRTSVSRRTYTSPTTKKCPVCSHWKFHQNPRSKGSMLGTLFHNRDDGDRRNMNQNCTVAVCFGNASNSDRGRTWSMRCAASGNKLSTKLWKRTLEFLSVSTPPAGPRRPDHASVQIVVADVYASGRALSTYTTFALCRKFHSQGESDGSLNRLEDRGLVRTSLRMTMLCCPTFYLGVTDGGILRTPANGFMGRGGSPLSRLRQYTHVLRPTLQPSLFLIDPSSGDAPRVRLSSTRGTHIVVLEHHRATRDAAQNIRWHPLPKTIVPHLPNAVRSLITRMERGVAGWEKESGSRDVFELLHATPNLPPPKATRDPAPPVDDGMREESGKDDGSTMNVEEVHRGNAWTSTIWYHPQALNTAEDMTLFAWSRGCDCCKEGLGVEGEEMQYYHIKSGRLGVSDSEVSDQQDTIKERHRIDIVCQCTDSTHALFAAPIELSTTDIDDEKRQRRRYPSNEPLDRMLCCEDSEWRNNVSVFRSARTRNSQSASTPTIPYEFIYYECGHFDGLVSAKLLPSWRPRFREDCPRRGYSSFPMWCPNLLHPRRRDLKPGELQVCGAIPEELRHRMLEYVEDFARLKGIGRGSEFIGNAHGRKVIRGIISTSGGNSADAHRHPCVMCGTDPHGTSLHVFVARSEIQETVKKATIRSTNIENGEESESR
ncbi:hypothetical protein NMY22_g13937 [Coprinellus aureogranulatus]|nr:hypothetical protein NMY22_g13937 [Coprinellus aureogranulatus]